MSSNYTQNNEETYIVTYLSQLRGVGIDIGANDGVKFSNSRMLVELGWKMHLIEPDTTAFESLKENTRHYPFAYIYNVAIGEKTEQVEFFKASDSLYSTCSQSHTSIFDQIEFGSDTVQMLTFQDWQKQSGVYQFDFLSIDAEGKDKTILSQIDVEACGLKLLVIEKSQDHSDGELINSMKARAFTVVYESFENLIFVRNDYL